ncbi:hypothetical protein [Sphingomonas sp.]|uniref:hypothetical protein n=1 Tax=Sphingomonas sp. TaxID=28214 RepID=UPI0031D4B038
MTAVAGSPLRAGMAAVVALLVVGLFPATAGAQTPQTSPAAQGVAPTVSDPIVVTARPLPERRKTLGWFGAISGYPDGDEPLSRMTGALCIAGVGLPTDLLLGVADRIMQNAQRLGIALGGEKCRPNVVILFVGNGAQQVRWLSDHRPGIFGNMQASEVSAMERDAGPVHAWNLTAITSRDGDQIFQMGDSLPTLHIPSASRINLPIKSQIAAAVILIDRRAVNGKTIGQLGDYATMRALAVVRPRKVDGVSTILSLFDAGGSAPEALTAFDWGYLRGLYSGQGDRRPYAQYVSMAQFVEQEIMTKATKP